MVVGLGVPIFKVFTVLKVNGYTLRGSNSDIFFSISFLSWGQLLKERISFHGSKFLL